MHLLPPAGRLPLPGWDAASALPLACALHRTQPLTDPAYAPAPCSASTPSCGRRGRRRRSTAGAVWCLPLTGPQVQIAGAGMAHAACAGLAECILPTVHALYLHSPCTSPTISPSPLLPAIPSSGAHPALRCERLLPAGRHRVCAQRAHQGGGGAPRLVGICSGP